MKRIFLTTILLSVMLLCVVPVNGAPSQKNDEVVYSVVFRDGTNSENIEINFHDNLGINIPKFEDVKANVVEDITKINSGESLEEVLKHTSLNLAGFKILNDIDDLIAYDKYNNVILHPKNVTVSWEVPNLSKNFKDVRVLHYSTVRNVWELITLDDLDFENKLITCTFEDLSPVCVIYNEAGQDNMATGDDTNLVFEYTLLISSVLVAFVIIKRARFKKSQ